MSFLALQAGSAAMRRLHWLTPGDNYLSFCPGEHEHTIVGYSLVKGIGDGEPIASERFTVGGHEWVGPSFLEATSSVHTIHLPQKHLPES